MNETTSKERDVAEQVLEVLIPGVSARVLCENEDSIRIAIQKPRAGEPAVVVFSKEGLRELAVDPQRRIKMEYMRRDVSDSASSRREFRYPRTFQGHC